MKHGRARRWRPKKAVQANDELRITGFRAVAALWDEPVKAKNLFGEIPRIISAKNLDAVEAAKALNAMAIGCAGADSVQGMLCIAEAIKMLDSRGGHDTQLGVLHHNLGLIRYSMTTTLSADARILGKARASFEEALKRFQTGGSNTIGSAASTLHLGWAAAAQAPSAGRWRSEPQTSGAWWTLWCRTNSASLMGRVGHISSLQALDLRALPTPCGP